MSNILNHNRDIIKSELDNSEYWDFFLSLDIGNNSFLKKSDGTLYDKCLIANIDLSDKECISKEKLYSKSKYFWNKSINKGFVFKNIGYTGVDNGIIKYDKTTITNAEFLEKYTNSRYKMLKYDYRLILNKIDGNNGLYDYSCRIKNNKLLELNGGFYQGFWKTKKETYQVLPDNIGNGITLEFTICKSDLDNKNYTINDAHEENKGMFFYIGTRAENKWWKYYTIKEEYEKCIKDFFSEEYIDKDYYKANINDNYTEINDAVCDNYFENGYIEDDVDINEDEKLFTDNGILINSPYRGFEIKTDNKFILFNRTDEGFTTENWDENYEVILDGIKVPKMENYFLLFNRTKDGFTTENIQELIDKKSNEYNINNDLYNNAFGLQITDNGEIGYKYLVKDCENIGDYKIIKEFSYEGVIENDVWYNISVVISPYIDVNECNPNTIINNKMIIKIYVNGNLKLISKELPIFNFRELNDSYEKQESVPYNISIGGGTQGLCDVIYINYMKEPEFVLPLEKEFCGSFIGYISDFKFYNCPLSYDEINSNNDI